MVCNESQGLNCTSEANNKILEKSLSDQSAVIEQMRVDIAQIQRINEEVNAEIGRQREEVNNLISKFNVNAKGESRDIGKIRKESKSNGKTYQSWYKERT